MRFGSDAPDCRGVMWRNIGPISTTNNETRRDGRGGIAAEVYDSICGESFEVLSTQICDKLQRALAGCSGLIARETKQLVPSNPVAFLPLGLRADSAYARGGPARRPDFRRPGGTKRAESPETKGCRPPRPPPPPGPPRPLRDGPPWPPGPPRGRCRLPPPA